jgi:hypothetical protein
MQAYIFQQLPFIVTILKNYEAKFKLALRKYLHTHFFFSVDEFFMCKDVFYCFCKMCAVFYTVNLYMCIYDLFHILLSLWHAYWAMEFMYFCMYVS